MTADGLDLLLDDDGAFPRVTLETGQRHRLVLRRPQVELERLYHDGGPVIGATYFVECANGQVVTGRLDGSGCATVPLPARPVQVTYSPDEREYPAQEATRNPTFRGGRRMSEAEVDVLVSKYATREGG